MTGSMQWRRLAVLLFVLALAGAGCRSTDDGASGGGGTEDATEADTGAATEPSTEAGTEESESGSESESPSDDPSASEGGGSEAAGEVAFDTGVTEEPCPDAVNADNGCVYLGTISDLTAGPFAALGGAIVESQAAFWRTVNEDGGIGGFDVNVTEYVRDNLYLPETHNQVYQEIKGDVLALAQTLGSPTTAAIVEDLEAEMIVAAPASWTSAWAFNTQILESGNNYCIESMNSIDYAVENFDAVESVMAVHYPGDYGGDAAAGARIAAEANGLDFTDVETATGADNQAGAVQQIVAAAPDLLIVATGPTDLAAIVGAAASQGFAGRIIGTSPTWNPGLLQSPAFAALDAQYLQSSPWPTYATDTPGHMRMREAIGVEDGNDGFTSGWVWSYPLLAVLEQAAENGDLTRAGVAAAVAEVDEVDYEGMLPEGAGALSGDPNESLVRGTVFQEPDAASSTGVTLLTEEFYTGPTAEGFDIGEEACFLAEG